MLEHVLLVWLFNLESSSQASVADSNTTSRSARMEYVRTVRVDVVIVETLVVLVLVRGHWHELLAHLAHPSIIHSGLSMCRGPGVTYGKPPKLDSYD